MAILMCRPDHFGIEYEINPWMKVANAVDHDLALQQWQALHDAYVAAGETVDLIDPIPGLPDLVFTANGGLIWGRNFVLSNFSNAERRGEEPYFTKKMQTLGFDVHTIDKSLNYEGAGDGLFAGETLFFGYGFRTDVRAHKPVAEILGVDYVSLQLVSPNFYHMDTCFCPLDEHTVMFAPDAFTPESADEIRKRVRTVIEVDLETARGFACNASPVGDTVIASTAILNLKDQLHAAGFKALGLPMTEFMKSGGGVRCLTLPLNLGPAKTLDGSFLTNFSKDRAHRTA